jgi:hypothetical protein
VAAAIFILMGRGRFWGLFQCPILHIMSAEDYLIVDFLAPIRVDHSATL